MPRHPIKMNFGTSFALLAVSVLVVSTITISSAYAEEFENRGLPYACVGCSTEDSIAAAAEHLRMDVPISVWTDKEEYGHNEIVMLTGYVANPAMSSSAASHVTVKVSNSIGSIVTIDQVDVGEDKTFEVMLNTAGRLWSYDGIYTIHVQHGQSKNKVQIELVGGMDSPLKPVTGEDKMDAECASDELTVMGHCVPYTIQGGEVSSANVNMKDSALAISITSHGDGGVLVLMPSSVVIDGVFMVLVDNEESNEYMVSDDGTITIQFGPGAELIEVIAEHVIPEFGAIAVMIFAVAVVAIIAISAKSPRLNIIAPRF